MRHVCEYLRYLPAQVSGFSTHSSVNMTSYRDGEIESNDGDCGLGDFSDE